MKSFVLMAGLCASAVSLLASTAQERLKEATDVFQEVMATPDKSIPQDLLEKAQCAVIVPGLKKGAFIVGAEFGKGFVTCRNSFRRRLGRAGGDQSGRRQCRFSDWRPGH